MQTRILSVALFLATGCARMAPAAVLATGADVNIFYGTAELYSSGGQLLSTTTAMTVETDTDFTYPTPQDAAFYLPLMGQSIVQQILSNALGYNVPSRFSNNLQAFEDSNGLGILISNQDQLNFPNTPASQQLFNVLTTQSVPFVITSDTGDIPLTNDTTYDIQYFFGPFGPLPTQPGNSIEGVVDVKLIDRVIHLQATAAPEPFSIGLVAGGLVLLAIVPAKSSSSIYRRRRPS